MNTRAAGFSLLEILVVVSIVAILAGVLLVNFSDTSASGRDAKRQADLRMLQNAIEMYKNKYGRYPEQCAATAVGSNGWSGQIGTDFRCDDNTGEYIRGLAPEFIKVLPVDPRPVSGEQGYVYRVDTDGSVYKIMSMNVVESEVVGPTHEFASCSIGVDASGSQQLNVAGFNFGGWCSRLSTTGGVFTTPNPTTCLAGNARFQSSYGVWGGVHIDTIRRLEGKLSPTACPADTFRFEPRTVQPVDSVGAALGGVSVGDANCRANTVRETAWVICQ